MHSRRQARLIFAGKGGPWLDRDGLAQLMAQNRIYNNAAGITGMAVYSGKAFLYCLEGQHAAITERYTQICHDPRYSRCRIIAVEPASCRMFPSHELELLDISRPDSDEPLDFLTIDAETARTLFHGLSEARVAA